MTAFDDFRAACRAARPATAVVLGSGLAGAAADFDATHTLPHADIPGLVPPTVAGHRGQLSLGVWAGEPVLVCFGRVHFYEGHPWPRVTRLVELVAELGVTQLVLTNAAGGLRPGLNPGDVMAIRAHVKLLGPAAWPALDRPRAVYSAALTGRMLAACPDLAVGVYAGLTGPCYETPAEIRALAACGVDAVGMSTVAEAEAAVALGLEVAGLSCVTNKAAGLGVGTLSHAEVEATARLAVAGVGGLVAAIL